LNDPKVKAVIICTPTPSHHELILKCVRAKKGVLCEKPIATELKQLDECYEEAKKMEFHYFVLFIVVVIQLLVN